MSISGLLLVVLTIEGTMRNLKTFGMFALMLIHTFLLSNISNSLCGFDNWYGWATNYPCFYHRESAMALNSLYPDGWFALGAAALKVTYVICNVLICCLPYSCTSIFALFHFCTISQVLGTYLWWWIQARDIEKALDGFTRAVQLDPDNGEAWNNIACLYALLFLHAVPSFYSIYHNAMQINFHLLPAVVKLWLFSIF